MNQYTIYWKDGKEEQVFGWNIREACVNAGIGTGALPAMDYWKISEEMYEEISKQGDHMTKEDFIECCAIDGFMDSNGFGVYATKDKMTNKYFIPSIIKEQGFDDNFTHVVWFNR